MRVSSGRLELGEAEVGDLEAPRAGDQNVGRLDVTVHDPLPMGVVQAARQLTGQIADLLERQDALLPEHRVEAETLHVLHGDVVEVAFLADIEDRDDVGMREGAGGAKLLLEARLHALELRLTEAGIGLDHLDGDVPLDDGIDSSVDEPHRALAEDVQDLVASELLREAHSSVLATGRGPR